MNKTEAREQFFAQLSQQETAARQQFQQYLRFPPHQSLIGTQKGEEWRRTETEAFEQRLSEWRMGEEKRFLEWETSGELTLTYGEPVGIREIALAAQTDPKYAEHLAGFYGQYFEPTIFDIAYFAKHGDVEAANYLAQFYGGRQVGSHIVDITDIAALTKAGKTEEAEILARFYGKPVTAITYPSVLAPPVRKEGIISPETLILLGERGVDIESVAEYVGLPYRIEEGSFLVEVPLEQKYITYIFFDVPVTISYFGETPTKEQVKGQLMTPKREEAYLGVHGWILPETERLKLQWQLGFEVRYVGGEPYQIKDVARAAKFFPERIMALHKLREATLHFQKVTADAVRLVEAQRDESEKFYKSIGFPQFGGKYAPFEVPEGHKIVDIVETAQGLEAKFKRTSMPLIVGIGTPVRIDVSTDKIPLVGIGTPLPTTGTVQPLDLQFIRGFWPAPTHKFQYIPSKGFVSVPITGFLTPKGSVTLSQLIYGKAEAREKIPSVLQLPSALSGRGLYVLGGFVEGTIEPFPSSIFELPSKRPEVIVGRVAGEAVSLWFWSKAFSQGWELGKELTPQIVKQPLGQVRTAVTGLAKAPFRPLEYQFKQHAPRFLLRTVYGKQLGEAIYIEREWGWGWTYSELLKGRTEFGKAVEYGVGTQDIMGTGIPFYRAETLHYSVPTKEWARIHAFERLYSQYLATKQLSWRLGLYPAYGISLGGLGLEIAKYPSGLPFTEKVMQAQEFPIYRLEQEMRLGFKGGKVEQQIRDIWTVPTGKKTTLSYKAGFEFEQQTLMPLKTQFFTPKPPQPTFKVFRGTPSTPFETTLRRAVEKETVRGLGGMTAQQLAPIISREFPLQPPSPQTLHQALVKPTRTVVRKGFFIDWGQIGLAEQITVPSKSVHLGLLATFGLKAFAMPKIERGVWEREFAFPIVTPSVKQPTMPEIGLKPMEVEEVRPVERQIQKVFQLQMLALTVPTTLLTKQAEKFFRDVPRAQQVDRMVPEFRFEPPRLPMFEDDLFGKRRRRRKGERRRVRVGWYEAKYPVKKARQMMKYLWGV